MAIKPQYTLSIVVKKNTCSISTLTGINILENWVFLIIMCAFTVFIRKSLLAACNISFDSQQNAASVFSATWSFMIIQIFD